MQDQLIQEVANLMSEQTASYKQLEAATKNLSVALTQGEPNKIENLTREGEKELLQMRSRLLDITSKLTKFAEIRAKQTENLPLEKKVREQFEESAKKLLEIAKEFERLTLRATNLALSGSSFATACIQVCGLPPTTYNAPILKNTRGENV